MTTPLPRHWFRFSLRTLLVLVAIVCILLGWKTNQVRRQRRAVELIQAHGGFVAYDYQYDDANSIMPTLQAQPPGPAWFRQLAGDDFFAKVVFVAAQNVDFPEASLLLAELPHLRSAYLDSTGVSDLTPLASLSDLKHLRIESWFWSESKPVDLSPLVTLKNLETICLCQSDVGNLSALSELPKLRYLDLEGTSVSDEEIEELQRALPNLTIHR